MAHHELGHSLDDIAASLSHRTARPFSALSNTREFTAAYKADLAAMSESAKDSLSYFTRQSLQSSNLSEAFAEAVATIMGTNRDSRLFRANFPSVVRWVEEYLASL